MRSAVFAAASAGATPSPRRRPGPSSPSSAVPSSASKASSSSFASSSSSPSPSSTHSHSRRASSPAPPSSTVASDLVAVRHVHEYRRNVGICLVNASGKVFAARRTDDTHGSWQMPQGGIDHLENPLAAAARELREETGIVSARVVAISRTWTAYDAPTRVRDPSRPGTPGALISYRGQTQKWVLMYYYGDDAEEGMEVDLGPEGSREFSEWGWRDLAEVAANVVPFKRRAYEAVAREFGPVIAARASSGGKGGGPGEGREESHVGWWGLHCHKSRQASHRHRSQILPASGVAMKRQQERQQR